MTLPASIKILLRAVRLRTGIAAATAAALVCAAPAKGSAPDWWETYGVIDSEATADDYAAVNAGQLKNIAAAAAAYLNFELAPIGGADTINTTIGAFGGSDDYLAVNIGQVKAVASVFYDQLIFIDYTGDYPWTGSSQPANDYALVNVGQVKNLFSFDLTEFDVYAVDTDGSGLPNWWQLEHFQTLGIDPEDTGNDSLTNLHEFLLGTDPNQVNMILLRAISGSGQLGMRNQLLLDPLKARVRDFQTGLPGLPLTYEVDFSTGGLLSVPGDIGNETQSVAIETDVNGASKGYAVAPDEFGTHLVSTSLFDWEYPQPVEFAFHVPVYVEYEPYSDHLYDGISHGSIVTESGETFFRRAGHTSIISNRFIPVDVAKVYSLSGRFKSSGIGDSKILFGFIPYDENQDQIYSWMVARHGEPIVIDSFDSAKIVATHAPTGWKPSTDPGGQRHLAFYYDGDTDRLPDDVVRDYDDGAFSEVIGDEIMLTAPLPTSVTQNIVIGTTVVYNQANSATYIYSGGTPYVPDQWTVYKNDSITGEVWAGSGGFWKGTHYVKLFLRTNHLQTVDHVLDFTEIHIKEVLGSAAYLENGLTFVMNYALREGLVARWPLTDSGGAEAEDLGPHGLTGTLSAGASWSESGAHLDVTATPKGYIDFDSMDEEALNLGDSSITLSGWFRTTDTGWLSFFSKGTYGYHNGFGFGLRGSTGRVFTTVGNTVDTSGDSLSVSTTADFNDGEWHHAVVTIDRSEGAVRIYVDGVAQSLSKITGTGSVSGTTLNFSTSTAATATSDYPAFIGAMSNFSDIPTYCHDGSLADIRVFERVLNEDEITALFYTGGFAEDANDNGIPDWWEMEFLGMLYTPDLDVDHDGDGQWISDEFNNGTDPTKMDNPLVGLVVW